MAAAAEAAAKLASAEAVLAEERAGRAAAASNGESLQHDFDRLVAAGGSCRVLPSHGENDVSHSGFAPLPPHGAVLWQHADTRDTYACISIVCSCGRA